MPTGTCPECEGSVQVATDDERGDIINCDECKTDLELVGLDPIQLDVYEEESLDEDDEEDF